MRNLRKYLAVLLAVAMMVAAIVPVTAASKFNYEDEAQTLHELGLFQGTSTDPKVFNPDLGLALDRQTGVVMLLRLFGLDKEAQGMDDADVKAALAEFTDGNSVDTWAKKEVAYAIDNGLIKGFAVAGGKFAFQPKTALEGKMYATLILRQLGYQDGNDGDFDYGDAVSSFTDVSGADEEQFSALASRQLTRDDLVGLSFASLKAAYKDEEKTVLMKLVDNGFVEKDVAEEKVPDAFVESETPAAPTATPTVAPTTAPTSTPVGQASISSVSFANQALPNDATKAKVNVVFGTAPAAVADSDFSVIQDVYVGTATTGTRTSVAGSVYSFDAAAKTAVLKVPAVAAGSEAKTVKIYVKYLNQALVQAPDYTVASKGFAVVLANDNPSDGPVNKGETGVFLSTTVTATGENTTVNSVTIKRMGGADTDIASIRLYNGTTEIGKTEVNKNLTLGVVTINLTSPLVVVPGTPVNLIVKATTSASATTGVWLKLGIDSMALASGTATGLPIWGNFKSVNNQVIGGVLKVTLAADNTAAKTVDAGSWIEAGRFDVEAQDQNAWIRIFNFENTGTAYPGSQITRLRIKDASTLTIVGTTSTGSIILTGQAASISANAIKHYIVEVELTSSTVNTPDGKTVALKLLPFVADNGTTSQTCQVVGAPVTFNTMTISNSTSVTFSRDTTTAIDDITVPIPTNDINAADGTVTANGVNQYFTPLAETVGYLAGVLSIKAGPSSDMTVKTLNMNIVANSGTVNANEIRAIGILDENNGVVLNPSAAAGATASSTFDTAGTGTEFDIVDQVVYKGTTKKYKVFVFLNANTDATGGGVTRVTDVIDDGDMFTLHAKTTNASSTSVMIGTTGATNLDTNLILGGDVAFRCVKAAAADTVQIGAPAAQIVNAAGIKGKDNVVVYKAKLTAGSEPLKIVNGKTITLYTRTLSTGTTLASGGKLIAYDKNGSKTTLATTSVVASLDATYTMNSGSDYVIRAGESAELEFYVKLSGTDDAASSFTVALSDDNDVSGFSTGANNNDGVLRGYTSNYNATVAGTYPTNVVSANSIGTFNVSAASDNLSTVTNLAFTSVAGASTADFVALAFTVSGNSTVPTKLSTVKLTKSADAAQVITKLTTLKVWDSNFKPLATVANAAEAKTTINIGVDNTIPAGGTATFYIGGTVSGNSLDTGLDAGGTDTMTLSIAAADGDLVVSTRDEDPVTKNVTIDSAVSTAQMTWKNVAADNAVSVQVDSTNTPAGTTSGNEIVCGSSGVNMKVASFDLKIPGGGAATQYNLSSLKITNVRGIGTDDGIYTLKDASGREIASVAAVDGVATFTSACFYEPLKLNKTDWTRIDVWTTLTAGSSKQIKIGAYPTVSTDVTVSGKAVTPTENVMGNIISGKSATQ